MEIDILLSKGAIMDKSDKYWSCSDKESLFLRGDSNLLFARTYLLLLTLLTFVSIAILPLAFITHGNTYERKFTL